jgi:hypothetical protein
VYDSDDDEILSQTGMESDLTCTPDNSKTVTYSMVHGSESAAKVYGPALTTYSKHLQPDWNPWHPFQTAHDYQLGRFMLEHNQTKTAIDIFLDRGLDHDRTQSFHNADELWNLFENSDFGFGPFSWKEHKVGHGTLYCRDVMACIQLLLRHLPFADHTAYEPVRLHDRFGNQVYNEIYTGDW